MKARINFVANAVALVLFLFLTLSGLELHGGGHHPHRGEGPTPGLSGPSGLSGHAWKDLHFVASLLFILVVLVHLVLHWRWIVCAVKAQGLKTWAALVLITSFLVATYYGVLNHHSGS